MKVGYRWVLGTEQILEVGYRWVPGTERISEVGYRWVPGTERISKVGYRWVPGTEQISEVWVPLGKIKILTSNFQKKAVARSPEVTRSQKFNKRSNFEFL